MLQEAQYEEVDDDTVLPPEDIDEAYEDVDDMPPAEPPAAPDASGTCVLRWRCGPACDSHRSDVYARPVPYGPVAGVMRVLRPSVL